MIRSHILNKKFHLILAIFLPIQIILVSIIKHFPESVEHYYSHKIFPVVSGAERFILGKLPFSVGDLLYFVFGLLILLWVYRRIKTKFRNPKDWVLKIFSTASLIYFCFHLFWGFNYYRLPLHKSLEIDADYSHTDLVKLTEKLIEKSNQYHTKLAQEDSVKVDFNLDQNEMTTYSLQGYDIVGETYPEFNYNFKNVKSSLYSLPLTYMGFSGYLNPFTNEAQVNAKIPNYRLPTVTAHEMGHQLGFAKENEANFMAVLSTINHSNPYFKYAGYTFALQYCLSEVYKTDTDQGKELNKKLKPGIRKNFKEVHEFWEAHENPFEPFFKLFYGRYLKINNQPEGMRSYNYVVGLLVNYYKDEQAL